MNGLGNVLVSPKPPGDALRRSYSPRRFASRHVPTAAEELAAQSHFLDPMIIKRFDGDLGAT